MNEAFHPDSQVVGEQWDHDPVQVMVVCAAKASQKPQPRPGHTNAGSATVKYDHINTAPCISTTQLGKEVLLLISC